MARTDQPTGLTEPDLTIERAKVEMGLRTRTAIDLWGMDEAAWAVDLDSDVITFTSAQKGADRHRAGTIDWHVQW
jgi:hypothetical protein